VSGDDVEPFVPTLEAYVKWLRDGKFIGGGVTSAFVTCGDWDLKTMFPLQVCSVGFHCITFLFRPRGIFWILHLSAVREQGPLSPSRVHTVDKFEEGVPERNRRACSGHDRPAKALRDSVGGPAPQRHR
jgi:hypothetical protein